MEGDFVKYLAEQARSGVAALHEYRLVYSDDQSQAHIFVEGEEDALFYLAEIRARCDGRDVNLYICGGKNGVILARESIKTGGYNYDECLFFVDRDFDDFTENQVYIDESTYLTDFYSIENDIVSGESLEVFLLDICGLSKARGSYGTLCDDLEREAADFAAAIRPIMAWVLAMRAGGWKPNLNNANLAKVFKYEDGKWSRSPDGFYNFMKDTVRETERVNLFSIRPMLKEFSRVSHKNWIRGKYELWFFERFLLNVLSNGFGGGKATKIPTALREHRLMEVLCGRIAPPRSLVEFLDFKLGVRGAIAPF